MNNDRLNPGSVVPPPATVTLKAARGVAGAPSGQPGNGCRSCGDRTFRRLRNIK